MPPGCVKSECLGEPFPNITSASVDIDIKLYERIHDIAQKCMLSDRDVLNRLLRNALMQTKLRERTVYEMEFSSFAR